MTEVSEAGGPTSTVSLGITGMTCASCVGRVERAIAKVPGVSAVAVNLATESATITTDGSVDAVALAEVVPICSMDGNRPNRSTLKTKATPSACGTAPTRRPTSRTLSIVTWSTASRRQ